MKTPTLQRTGYAFFLLKKRFDGKPISFLKSIFLTLLFVLTFHFQSTAQLSSVEVNVDLVPATVVISDSTITGSALNVGIQVNDISDLGEIVIDILDAVSTAPLLKYEYTAAQITELGLFVNGSIQIVTGLLNPAGSYIIKTSVRNINLANLPQMINTFPNN